MTYFPPVSPYASGMYRRAAEECNLHDSALAKASYIRISLYRYVIGKGRRP